MSDEKYKDYLTDFISLLKEQAREAKREADHPKEWDDSYSNGYLMAYHMVISLMKHQALVFNIDQAKIGLADTEPERDLL